MKLIRIIACLVLTISAEVYVYAATGLTTITQTIKHPDGTNFNGSLEITLNAICVEPDGTMIYVEPRLVSVTDGAFKTTLYPNSLCTPSGTSYMVRYRSRGNTIKTETWVVTDTTPTTIDAVRVATLPSTTYSVGLAQIAQGGAGAGQVLTWNGTTWAPASTSGTSVTSVFGRTGVVTATSGDYSFSLISGTVAATQGGTGLATFALGDTLYASAANTLAALSGNTTTTRKFLRQTGTGSASAAPAWDTILAGDVPTLNQNTTGNAATATALASNPSDCSPGQFANAIAANGNLTCATPAGGGDVSGGSNLTTAGRLVTVSAASTVTEQSAVTVSGGVVTATGFSGPITGAVTGNASTATALASNPTDCSAGQRATAISANGNLTCVAVNEINLVTDYGATGNGSTDDYAAIAAAITAAGAGGSIYAPAGTYKLSAGLTVASNNVTLRCSKGATFQRAFNATLFTVTGDDFLGEGCSFDGDNPSYTGAVVYFNGADRATFRNNKVYDGSIYGIYVFDSKDVTLQNNRVTGNLNIGIFAEYDSENVKIVGNYVDNSSCTALNCHNIGIHSTAAGDAVDNAIVAENTLVNSSNDAFCIEWGKFGGDTPSRVAITGNVCNISGTDSAGGISVSQGNGGSITGNVLDAGTTSMDSSTIAGIELVQMTDTAVTGNTIRMPSAVGGTGIQIQACTNLTVVGNTIDGFGSQADDAGIYVVASTSETNARLNISNNTIKIPTGNAREGIYVSNLHATSVNSGHTISGNYITGDATSGQACITLDDYVAGTMSYNAVLNNQLDNCDDAIVLSGSDYTRVVGNGIPRFGTRTIYMANSPTTPLIDTVEPMTYAQMTAGTPANGSRVYCSDCNSTCSAGSSTGKVCGMVNGAWAAF